MIKKSLLAIAVVAAFAVNAQAAIRTIDINYVLSDPRVPTDSSGWVVDEVLPNVTIDDSNGLGLNIYHQAADVGGLATTFSSTGLVANAGRIDFENATGEQVFMRFPAFAGANTLADIPDGTHLATVVNLFGMGMTAGNTNDLRVTIGTAAIPEPSAFAFGGLALALVGVRRWGRNWFGKADA